MKSKNKRLADLEKQAKENELTFQMLVDWIDELPAADRERLRVGAREVEAYNEIE